MILYKEIKKKDGVYFIVMENTNGVRVEIPLENNVAQRFVIYLDRITAPSVR